MDYNWDDGRLFLEVARQGQMKRAAQKLKLTPVTLTRRIAAFEARTGAPLFIRRRAGVELSDEGQHIFDALERAEAEMLAVGATLEAAKDISGTVRVAVPEGFLHGFVLPNLQKLFTQYPNLKVEFVPLPRHLSLSRREADVAVFVGKPSGDRIWCQKLCDYRLGLYADASYLKVHGAPQSTDDLRDHKLIGFVPDLLALPSLNYAKEAYPNWESQIAMTSPLSQMQAVKLGVGIGVLHTYLVEGRGLTRLLPAVEITRSYFVASHTNLRLQPRIQAILAFIGKITNAA